jgi:crotonobetainyl-CoA:carnitine CoA-transferase CaiB-like acyl-CoA transferase
MASHHLLAIFGTREEFLRRNNKMVESRRPLEGVKCVGAISLQQLPVAFSMMADLGAEVIKIERPGTGDNGRGVQLYEGKKVGYYFETNNRGLKSLTLDIQKKKGLEIMYKLVKNADIFAENFRPGVAERHHFSYEDLKKINLGIIYLASSTYGPDGPNAQLPGVDACVQAVGGIASLYGEKGSQMMTGQHSISDEASAMTNFGGLMVSLYHKKMTGEGTKIETSLLGATIRLMGYSMTRVLFTGEDIPRGRARVSGGVTPVLAGSFNDKNGRGFAFQIMGQEAWQKGMEAAGFSKRLAELGCAKLSEVTESEEKTQIFLETMDKLFVTDTRERIVKALRDVGIFCAPINTVLEASRDPDVIANNYITEVDHPKAGKIKEVGFPWKFSSFTPKAGIAPELGEHNQVILHGLGYSDKDIAELKREQVI